MAETGTREWSTQSENAGTGCPHGCLYCYARWDMVHRFKKFTDAEWSVFKPNHKNIDNPVWKTDGVVMFPTAHDITPENVNECMVLMRKHLDAGNQLLITTKPHWQCITLICEAYQEFKEQIMFRFTIGSAYPDILSFWEPGAPNFDERLGCLQYAYEKGYQTSVSCEPYLDQHVKYTFVVCKPYITDSFWVGMLRNFNSRVKLTGSPEDGKYVEKLKRAQTTAAAEIMYGILRNEPLVKWKDSARKVLGI